MPWLCRAVTNRRKPPPSTNRQARSPTSRTARRPPTTDHRPPTTLSSQTHINLLAARPRPQIARRTSVARRLESNQLRTLGQPVASNTATGSR